MCFSVAYCHRLTCLSINWLHLHWQVCVDIVPVLVCMFWHRVSLYGPGWLGTLCRPGCFQPERSAYLCFLWAGIKSLQHCAGPIWLWKKRCIWDWIAFRTLLFEHSHISLHMCCYLNKFLGMSLNVCLSSTKVCPFTYVFFESFL